MYSWPSSNATPTCAMRSSTSAPWWLGTISTVMVLVGSPATTMLPEVHVSMLMSTGSEHGKSQLVMAMPFCAASECCE